jgi:flagellar biosynthetic protein FliR
VTIPLDLPLLSAFFLALMRASSWIVIAPPLANRVIPARIKIGFSAAIALASAPMIKNPPVFGSTEFLMSILLQIGVGLSLGFLTQVLFSVFQGAGGLIDTFSGFTIATFYDPMAESQSTVFARLYQLIAVTLLFVTGAFQLMVLGFMRTFQVIPAGGIPLARLETVLLGALSQFLVAAIEIAGPVLIVLFLSEVMLGILTKAAPQLNVFSVSFSLRIVLALGCIAFALPLLIPSVDAISNQILEKMRF